MAVTSLDELLQHQPLIHGDGGKFCWRLNDDTLRFIRDNIGPDSHTLETGAGVSTMLFALVGTKHICITPDTDEVQRIKTFCANQQISADKIEFKIARSEDVLPGLGDMELDLVVLDGRHGYPAPCIDWYYTTGRLRIGGTLVLDDTPLWPVHILSSFLEGSPRSWKVKARQLKSIAFTKLAEGSHSAEWDQQEFSVRQSRWGLRKLWLKHQAILLRAGKAVAVSKNILRPLVRR